MSEPLEPCPFCGGEAEFERLGTPRVSCQVSCTMCGAHHESSDEGRNSGSSWNRRSVRSQLSAAEAKLKIAMEALEGIAGLIDDEDENPLATRVDAAIDALTKIREGGE